VSGVGQYESPLGCGSVRAGEVWIGPAGCAYRYFCRRRWDVAWFHFYDTPRWACLRGERVSVRPSGIIPQLKLAAEGFISEAVHSSGKMNAIARNYAEIVGAYLDRELLSHEDARDRHDRLRLENVWDCVHGDLQRRWTVNELAKLAHLSAVQFHRIVLRRHGCTPKDVVSRLRMQRAEQMLLASECKLDQIAEPLGYKTPFAFSRAFKRCFGVSPGFYRERNKGRG
jgi:AraC family transcriptional regulator, arabinose operon regulatory protein